MPAQVRAIHVTEASGVASATGWYAYYHEVGESDTAQIVPLACWVLLQTRATSVEVPNTPPIPVVMGMVTSGMDYALIHAPMLPGWVFQRYLTEDEADDFRIAETIAATEAIEKLKNEAAEKIAKRGENND